MNWISYFKGTKGDYVQVTGPEKHKEKMIKYGFVLNANDLPEVIKDGDSRRSRKPRTKSDTGSAE